MIQINLKPNLEVSFTEKSDGNFGKRFGFKRALQNRKITLKKLNLTSNKIAQLEVSHSSRVKAIKKSELSKTSTTIFSNLDGLLTNDKSLALLLTTGDCIPLILYDTQNESFGLCHVGWRGAMAKIQLHALFEMIKKYKSNLQDLKILFGPSICGNCYTWTTPPPQLYFPDWDKYVLRKKKVWHVDLVNYVKDFMIEAGISKDRIQILNTCTYHDKNWFSHQKSNSESESNGRFATIVRFKKING